MIECRNCGMQPIRLTDGSIGHCCYVLGEEQRFDSELEWEKAQGLVRRCGNCKSFVRGDEYDPCAKQCCLTKENSCCKSWEPMTMGQFYLTPDKAPYLVINEVVGDLDGKPDTVVKQMYYKGEHVVTIARDDFEKWLENPHYEVSDGVA